MKILGIDYGRKKIGLALGDTASKLVEPLGVLTSAKFKVQSSKLIGEMGVERIVIGVPGERIEKEIRGFGNALKKETNLPVEFFDETLTTQDAQRLLIESGKNRKSRKEKEDAIAAALMLESYLLGNPC